MDNTHQSHEISYNAFAYESITVSSTAQKFTKATYDTDEDPQRARKALVTVETAAIRYRVDGTDPTSSEGHKLGVGDVLTILGYGNIKRFRAIRVSSDATIKVTYER